MFNNIIGNSLIIQSIQNSILTNTISHAYIFSGKKGSGKKLLANTFAKTLQCEKKGINFCNTCVSCISYSNNNHPDVHHITLNNTKNIGIFQVKDEIIAKVNVKSYRYTYKIFIIDNADKLTVASQNALLKTIEEPNFNCIFIFLTKNYSSLLSTVLSRCVLYKINPLSFDEVKNYLINNYSFDETHQNLLAAYSSGSIGYANVLATDADFIVLRNYFIDIAQKIKEYDLVKLFYTAKEIERFKDKIQDGLDILYIWYRDVLVYKETKSIDYLLQKDMIFKIINTSEDNDTLALLRKLEAIWDAKVKLHQFSNFQLTIEVMLFQLKEII